MILDCNARQIYIQFDVDVARITVAEVKNTLRAIRSGDPVDSALVAMNVVTERLREGASAPTLEARSWTLVEMLDQVARASLIRLRGRGDTSFSSRPRAEELVASMRADFAVKSIDLEAWSCLHHRYLSAYPLQVQELAHIVLPGSPHGRRLISRRLGRGYALLAGALRDLEQQANSRAADGPAVHRWAGVPVGRASDASEGEARPSAGTVPASRLPRWRTSLVGRRTDLKGVVEALVPGALVSLVGPPGVGKTRLAAEAAALASADCPDGVAFIDLVTLRDPRLVESTVAGALGVSKAANLSATGSVVQALAGRRALLVLDSCEHLAVACAALADALLDGCPDIRLLVTSRERLNVRGERVWRLDGLGLPAAGQNSVTEVADAEAVRLFVERATAADHRFELTGDNADAIAEICRRLDGLPLAIELAAARAAAVPVHALLEHLGEVCTQMSGWGGRARLGSACVCHAIRWSYELLGPAHQAVFRRLGAFSGPWSLPAAEAICVGGVVDARDVFGYLADLTDKSLLTAFGDAGRLRYRFLAPVAQAARQLLCETDEAAAVRDRHLAWYRELADSAAVGLRGPDQATWLARVADEGDNFRAAIEWACGRSDREAALRLTSALSRSWRMRGLIAEGRLHLADALSIPGDDAAEATARALEAAGTLARVQGDLVGARGHLQQALALRRRLGDEEAIGGTLRELGAVADEEGSSEEAIALHARSLEAAETVGNAWDAAAARNGFGLALYHHGSLDEAYVTLEEAVSDLRRTGDRWAVGGALGNLGHVTLDRGDLDGAEGLYRESWSIAREFGDLVGVAASLTGMGRLALRRGDAEAARRCCVEGGRVLLEVDDRRHLAGLLELVADVESIHGGRETAVRLYAAAGALREEIGAMLSAKERDARSSSLQVLEGHLGEAAFRHAWREGASRRWRDVAAEVFGVEDR